MLTLRQVWMLVQQYGRNENEGENSKAENTDTPIQVRLKAEFPKKGVQMAQTM